MTLKERILKLMARRDHSIQELRNKLQAKPEFNEEDFAAAIDWLQKKGFLPDEEVLAEKVACYLRKRGKGDNWIKMQLYKKGLPTKGAINRKAEVEAAQRILTRIKSTIPDKEKWAKKLINRGFTPLTVATVLGRNFEDSF